MLSLACEEFGLSFRVWCEGCEDLIFIHVVDLFAVGLSGHSRCLSGGPSLMVEGVLVIPRI